jgi:hypothetical protein
MSSVVLRLVPVDADDGCLTDAERELCEQLGTPALRRASRVAAKRAAAALLEPRVPFDDLSPLLLVGRGPDGAPELAARTDLAQPLPAVTMSHSAGWGAALAWLP